MLKGILVNEIKIASRKKISKRQTDLFIKMFNFMK